jgi:S-DNA-T family DNA segregation ATPase FtsK/SpoIIIE
MVTNNMAEYIKTMRSQLEELREPVTETPTEPIAWHRPELSLLDEYTVLNGMNPMEASVIEGKFAELGIRGKVENIRRGPVVTRYEIRLAPGQKISEVRSIKEDLEITLSNKIRILAPIPGTALVGLEVVNNEASTIGLRGILKESKGSLPIAIGVDTVGTPKVIDLTKMPHLLIAGQTGSGKSVCLNAIILSILYNKTPEECQLILVDPKRVEMTAYRDLPNLRQPVVTEPEEAVAVFEGLVTEMEERYRALSEAGVRNIDGYNAQAEVKMLSSLRSWMRWLI